MLIFVSKFFIFTPTWGNDPIWHNLTNIFEMGGRRLDLQIVEIQWIFSHDFLEI